MSHARWYHICVVPTAHIPIAILNTTEYHNIAMDKAKEVCKENQNVPFSEFYIDGLLLG